MIKTITYCARSMLLNAMICWTDVMTTRLWPYAIKLVIDMGNNCPDDSGLTTLERFHQQKDILEWKISDFWITLLHLRPQTFSKEIYSKMDTSIKTSLLSWYITAAFRKCRSGSKDQNWIYFSTIPHHL